MLTTGDDSDLLGEDWTVTVLNKSGRLNNSHDADSALSRTDSFRVCSK